MVSSRSLWRLIPLLAALIFLTPALSFAAPFRLTFEAGQDGAAIAATIPGLRFSLPGGGDWFYGDARSGKYDAPYPRGALAVDGNGFAWTGERAGEGRIDFTAGPATFFAAAFSTKASLSIAAYNGQGQEIAARVLRANANTGRLEGVRLDAPSDQGIAYVLISGAPNRWIMDNLEVATLPASTRSAEPARVTVVQQLSPSLGAPAGSIITYTIVATNRGRGPAITTIIALPFDPDTLRVVDARFSRTSAWVSKLLTNTLEIETGRLGSGGDTVTATVRLAVLPEAMVGAALGERLNFSWSDGAGGGQGHSNLPPLAVAAAVNDPPTYPLAVSPARGVQGSTHTVSSPIFAPHEPVAFWYDASSGESIAVDTASADDTGVVTVTFMTSDLEPGHYTMVARGLWTGFTAMVTFVVESPTA